MSESSPGEIAKKTVVYELAGMEAVRVRRDVEYGPGLTLDVYSPGDATGALRPAVLIVCGYSDHGMRKVLGRRFKELGSSVSWSRLIAASGMAAITYTNDDPATDVHTVLRYVLEHGESLGIDAARLGLWASSGNVPLALTLLMGEPERVRCAALSYGLMLDLDGATVVADAARQWGFANPCAGRSVEDLPLETPLFVARAGRDQVPGLNDTIDRYLSNAVARNMPLTFVNHPTAPHAFDLFDGSDMSREIIRSVLAFLRFHLLGGDRRSRPQL